jgi:hypothetical protein
MATTIKSTDLDFDTVKTRLKDYLKAKPEFADYNFEASGLSNVLDVLAYNTHFNGLTANFALNESFLNTAQLRASVVSHAEALGYTPRSYTSSKANLNISLTIASANRPTTITLPRGTAFTSSVAGVSYTFRTLESYSAQDDGSGFYEFKTETDSNSIPVYEGIEKTKTFFVGETDETQIYVMPDVTLDTESLLVKVYETSGSSTFETYTSLKKAIRITTESKHYQIKEVPNGFFEVLFGDGVTTGKSPEAGNKIVITYLSTVGPTANGASVFVPTGDLDVEGTNYPITAVTESVSSAGAFKEGLESIRQTAPIYFASQQRLVTAEDYKAQILANYSAYIDDVISWGGNDNVPVEYGKVFVGLKFKTNISSVVQTEVKDKIVNELTNNLSVMSIDTEFTESVISYLELQTFFNFDPDLTNATPRATENLVFSTIQDYFTQNLGKFGKVFRRSTILSLIDDLDEAILNSRMNVRVQQRFTPITGQPLTYTLNFPMAIANPSNIDRIVTTGRFEFNGKTCFIRNKLNQKKLELVNIDGDVELDNIGEYDTGTGKVLLQGFNPVSIEGGSVLKVTATPTNQSTLRPLRNYIIDIDPELSFAQSQIDFQNTQLTL